MAETDYREIYDEIVNQVDLVEVISSYIPVRRNGRSVVALCPFHDDHHESLHINGTKRIWKCFSCNTGGNVIGFVSKFKNISYMEAAREIAEQQGLDIPLFKNFRRMVKKVDPVMEKYESLMEEIGKFYQMTLSSEEGAIGREYLQKREIDEEIQKKFSIGFAPSSPTLSMQYMTALGYSYVDMETLGIAMQGREQYIDRNAGRVIFPLKDENGKIVGFSARRVVDDDSAKYVNTSETPIFHKGNLLYHYDVAKRIAKTTGYVYVVEGFMDAIALDRVGIGSVVALMGTAMTEIQAQMLKRLNTEVRMCLDSDLPGQTATMKNISILEKFHIPYRIVRRSKGPKDADEILEKYGAENLRKYLQVLVDKVQFSLSYYEFSNPLETIDQKQKFFYDFLPLLCEISDQFVLTNYAAEIAKRTGFDREMILQEVQKRKQSSKQQVTSTNHFKESRWTTKEDKKMRRLRLFEKKFVTLMLLDSKAIAFYIKKDIATILTEPLLKKIAECIADSSEDGTDAAHLISKIQMVYEDDPQKDEMVSMVYDLDAQASRMEFKEEYLDEYYQTILYEREKQMAKYRVEKMLEGKSELEKVKILQAILKEKGEQNE